MERKRIEMDSVMRSILSAIYRNHDPDKKTGRGRYDSYEHLIPEYVKLVEFRKRSLNCAGFALDLPTGTSDAGWYLDELYVETEKPTKGGIYVLFTNSDEAWMHLGKIVDDQIGISKWGWHEPVFKGPMEFYPGTFGSIGYFVKKDEDDRN